MRPRRLKNDPSHEFCELEFGVHPQASGAVKRRHAAGGSWRQVQVRCIHDGARSANAEPAVESEV